jgi:hypothetical protein
VPSEDPHAPAAAHASAPSCQPSAWLKVEAERWAQVVQASGTQVTPKASLRQLKKYAHGREQKQTSVEKIKRCLLLLTAIFADTHSIFF